MNNVLVLSAVALPVQLVTTLSHLLSAVCFSSGCVEQWLLLNEHTIQSIYYLLIYY